MKKNSIGLPVIGAMAIAMGLGGCADENPWSNAGSETGSINLTLTTDYEFDTAKPVFRSGEGETGETRAALDDYTSVPTAEAFHIKLENTKGYSHEWRSLTDFNADESIKGLATGLYTITAYYGDMATTGADCPYFEAKSSFTVLPNKTSEVELNAELKNSMVHIDYTEDFKNYMKEFTTSLSTKGSTEITSNTYNEKNPLPEKTKAIFIEPKEVKVDVSFTTKETGKTASVNIGTFAALAKTLHRMTLDINHKNNGFATLTVTFDEETGSETVDVDLTEQLFATEAPSITYIGTNGAETPSGATINMLENPTVAFSVIVPGGLNAAMLTINSTGTSGFSKVIDLRNTDPATLTSEGIIAKGFHGDNIETTNTMATLDITEYAKALSSGDYSVKLDVTDKSNRTASFQLYANTEQVEAKLAKDGDNNLTPDIVYASDNTELILDYNGNDYQELTFKASDASGNLVDVTANYVKSEMLSTRGYENRRCRYKVPLPYSKKTKVNFAVYNKGGEKIADFEVPVAVPQYTITDVDAFSKFAYLKIEPNNNSDLNTIIENIGFNSINSSDIIRDIDKNKGIIAIKGLTPGTSYTLKHSIAGEYTDNQTTPEFKTENADPIPNGDFSATSGNVSAENLKVGGEYRVAVTYQHKSSFNYTLPAEWATINSLTAYNKANNMNTWYVVPSSWIENNSGYIRTVGYNHDGPIISKSHGATTYYCTNSPDKSNLNTVAGELFLGSYSFNGSENRNEGITFLSRPSSITFDYQFSTEGKSECKEDQGYACIEILDNCGNKLHSEIIINLDPTTNMTEKVININYSTFGLKAAELKIKFKSSNQATPPIHIPTNEELNEHQSLGSKTIAANQYHAVATGSVLKIDNVTAHYATEPPAEASAVKRNTNKKKRR